MSVFIVGEMTSRRKIVPNWPKVWKSMTQLPMLQKVEMTIQILLSHVYLQLAKDEWILDSACTYHICPNSEFFSNLEELEGRVIYMDNDASCTIMDGYLWSPIVNVRWNN